MEKNTLRNCSFVKTILMLMVIIGHSCAFWSGHWFTEDPAIASNGLRWLYSWISSFHIYGFALVSGYLFAFKIDGGYRNYPFFLKNKAKRLLVPYVFVMLIWVAPISVYFFRWDLNRLFRTYVLCVDPSQLWFLWMLFDVFAIVWPLRKVMMDRPLIGWVLSMILYGIGIFGRRSLPNYYCIWTACQYVPFFYAGMRIRAGEMSVEKDIVQKVPWFAWLAADVVLFICSTMAEVHVGIVWSLLNVALTFLLHIVGAIMAWTVLQYFSDCLAWRQSRVFKTLSGYAMPIYLFHQQIIYFTITWLNGRVNPWINAGVNLSAALVGSILISSLLMRWKPTRMLVGEK